MGIHPDFIVARSVATLDKRRRERFSLFCSVPYQNIIDAPDLKSIYDLPQLFKDQKFDQKVLSHFDLPVKPLTLKSWTGFTKKVSASKKHQVNIGIILPNR